MAKDNRNLRHANKCLHECLDQMGELITNDLILDLYCKLDKEVPENLKRRLAALQANLPTSSSHFGEDLDGEDTDGEDLEDLDGKYMEGEDMAEDIEDDMNEEDMYEEDRDEEDMYEEDEENEEDRDEEDIDNNIGGSNAGSNIDDFCDL